MRNEVWENVKKIYRTKFNTPERILDLIAVDEILRLACTGVSSQKISNYLNMQMDYLNEVLVEFLGFFGWEKDLDINPYFIFKHSENYENFLANCMLISPLITSEELKIAYQICTKYRELRKEIDNFYDD